MEMPRCDRLYLDGGWRLPAKPAAAIPIISPVTERVIGSVARGSALDVEIAVAAARGAFASFSATSPSERGQLLERILTFMGPTSVKRAQHSNPAPPNMRPALHL